MILGFNIYAWITIATVVVTFSVLTFTKLRSDLVFLGVVGVLFVTGVLDVNEALSGFSSTTVAVVGVMFVVVAGLTYTGVLHWIEDDAFETPDPYLPGRQHGGCVHHPCAAVEPSCQRVLREQLRPRDGGAGSGHSGSGGPSGWYTDDDCAARFAAREESA